MTIAPDRLSSFLFFNNEQALYGLLPVTDEEVVHLNTNEFLQVFAGKAHPFATFAGRTTNDEAHLSALREAARLWNEPDFWQHAELDAGMIRFDEEKIGISALSSMILHDAIREKIEASAMQLDQLPALLPHLRKFGWPGDSVSTMPVRVAFRLTEPDADSDTEWLLGDGCRQRARGALDAGCPESRMRISVMRFLQSGRRMLTKSGRSSPRWCLSCVRSRLSLETGFCRSS